MAENPVISLFLALAVIITMARFAGALARRCNQPRVLGELLAGVVLGPTLLDLIHWPVFHDIALQSTLGQLSDMGVLLLMFLVGLEVQVHELAKVRRVAMAGGVFGALMPVLLMLPIGLMLGYALEPTLFAGVVLAATSVTISAQVLLEMGILRSKEGNALLAAALVDDVVAILLVSLTVALTAGDGNASTGNVVGVLVRMTVYLVGAVAAAWLLVPLVLNWIARQPALAHSFGVAAFGLVLMFIFAWSAESLGGVATITGAFIAGVGVSRSHRDIRQSVETASSNIAYTLLVPVFFIHVGLQTNLRSVQLAVIPLVLLLLLVAVVSKAGGSGLGALLGGFNRQEALRVGVCMIARGEVGLIIASMAVNRGILEAEDPLFVGLFITILLTTLITPILVRQVFPYTPIAQERER